MLLRLSVAALLLCCLWLPGVLADTVAPAQGTVQTAKSFTPEDRLSISPHEAYRLQQSGVPILDVRSRAEFELVGHPVGATNIPYKLYPAWQVDPNFIGNVKDWAGDRTVMVICRSGKRGMAATKMLRSEGVNAINILEGFEGPKGANGHRDTEQGWRNRNLPWEY